MKKILTAIIILMFVVSCGKKEQSVSEILATENLDLIRKKKEELSAKSQELLTEIELLDNKISKLDTNKKIPLVTTLITNEKEFVHYLELQGSVQTKKNVLIYPEVAGQLVTVYVQKGQRVVKGQTLAKIDDAGMSNQLAQLEANEALAKTTYERQKRLWDQKIGSEIQFLQSKTNYEIQVNAVSNMKKNMQKFKVKAPFSGIIDDVLKEQGTVVAPGMGSEIFRIVNLSNMYIETDVPESYISTIKKGKDVEVAFPVLNKKMNSKIRQAGNFISPTNRTFKVEVGVSNKDRTIKPNLTAKLKINDYTNPKAILIPQSIISENAKAEQYVYIVEKVNNNKGVVKQIVIETGKTKDDNVEVLNGLINGMQVVLKGARSIKDGQEVEVLQMPTK